MQEGVICGMTVMTKMQGMAVSGDDVTLGLSAPPFDNFQQEASAVWINIKTYSLISFWCNYYFIPCLSIVN